MEPNRLDAKAYPSFGECIYCGARAGTTKLTDEHIVPYSLGGNAYISEASCEDCAKITANIEQELARRILGPFRSNISEQTRRRKERPTTASFRVSVNDGPMREYQLPVNTAPFFTAYPSWGIAGLISGLPPSQEFHEFKGHVFHWWPPNIRELLAVGPDDRIDLEYPDFSRIDHNKVARAIAKIAYCQAVVHWGLYGFRRLILPQIILGSSPLVPHFVGCPTTAPEPPLPGDVKHSVVLAETAPFGLRLLVADVRLYASSGTEKSGSPTYHVVVGAPPLKGWKT